MLNFGGVSISLSASLRNYAPLGASYIETFMRNIKGPLSVGFVGEGI